LTLEPDSPLDRALQRAGIRPAPPDGPLRPADLVECPLGAALLAACCGARHVAKMPSGGGRGFPRFPGCASCARGALHVERLRAGGWEPPPDSIPAETLPNTQRRARRQWASSFPAYAEPRDERMAPLAEIAITTPDDRGLGTDVG